VATDIYIFSGTGNSLHAAKELQKGSPESNLVPIVRLLRQEVIETRGGTPSEAFGTINAALRKQGKELNAQMNVTMPWNHPLGDDNLPALATEERIEELEADMQKKPDVLSAHIREHKPYLRPDTEASYEMPGWSEAMASLIPLSVNYELHRFMYQDLVHFYSDPECTSCGICEAVCLSQKIEIVAELRLPCLYQLLPPAGDPDQVAIPDQVVHRGERSLSSPVGDLPGHRRTALSRVASSVPSPSGRPAGLKPRHHRQRSLP
jgi:ferredoxin